MAKRSKLDYRSIGEYFAHLWHGSVCFSGPFGLKEPATSRFESGKTGGGAWGRMILNVLGVARSTNEPNCKSAIRELSNSTAAIGELSNIFLGGNDKKFSASAMGGQDPKGLFSGHGIYCTPWTLGRALGVSLMSRLEVTV